LKVSKHLSVISLKEVLMAEPLRCFNATLNATFCLNKLLGSLNGAWDGVGVQPVLSHAAKQTY